MKFIPVLLVSLVIASASVSGAQSVSVDIVLNPMGDFKAKSNDVKGTVKVSGDQVVAENIVVDLRKLKTGVTLRDKHTQKHLDTKKFPEAILSIAKGKSGKGTGKIKIRGVEKDISGTYTLAGGKLNAKFKLKLSDFDIKDINYMGVGVEDEVTITVSVPTAKK